MAFVALFLNVTTIDLNDMSIATLEFHMEVFLRLVKGKIALITHSSFYQYFSATIKDTHWYARGGTAV